MKVVQVRVPLSLERYVPRINEAIRMLYIRNMTMEIEPDQIDTSNTKFVKFRFDAEHFQKFDALLKTTKLANSAIINQALKDLEKFTLSRDPEYVPENVTAAGE